jgi:hypothetical protein
VWEDKRSEKGKDGEGRKKGESNHEERDKEW